MSCKKERFCEEGEVLMAFDSRTVGKLVTAVCEVDNALKNGFAF